MVRTIYTYIIRQHLRARKTPSTHAENNDLTVMGASRGTIGLNNCCVRYNSNLDTLNVMADRSRCSGSTRFR